MNYKLKCDEPGNPFSPHAKWYGIKRLARSPIDNWTTPRSEVFKKSGEREIKVRERERVKKEWKYHKKEKKYMTIIQKPIIMIVI